jgi:hypothetical protein
MPNPITYNPGHVFGKLIFVKNETSIISGGQLRRVEKSLTTPKIKVKKTGFCTIVLLMLFFLPQKSYSQLDSARVLIFFADTSLIYSITNNIIPYYDPNIHWQFGYEVTRQVYVPAGAITQGGNIYGWGDYTKTKIIAYLDSQRKELPKTIVVLQTIKL